MSYLRAGTGRADITPPPGTPQGGWGAQTHQRGTGTDMPLFATALVLSDGVSPLALVEADTIGFEQDWTNKILQAIVELTGLPRDRVRFSCSHTHAGPNTFRIATITEGRDMAVRYLQNLPQQIAGAVWQALQDLHPARCAGATGSCDISVNRRLKLNQGHVIIGRNWEGPADKTVQVVRFDDYDENPIATIVHYACHPTTLAWQNKLFSPDYPGTVRRVVEQEVGGLCLFLQGAAGNLMPQRGFTGDTSVALRIGRILGLEAAGLALGIETLPRRERLKGVLQSGTAIGIYEDEPIVNSRSVLRMFSRLAKLPLKQFPDPDQTQGEFDRSLHVLQDALKDGNEEKIRGARAQATQAGWRAENSRRFSGKSSLEWEMMGIRIDDMALLSIPGEPFIEISQEIRESSPFSMTLVSGYSNGGFGYLPDRIAYSEGGYEVEASPFTQDASQIVVEEGNRLLRELHS